MFIICFDIFFYIVLTYVSYVPIMYLTQGKGGVGVTSIENLVWFG